MSEDVRKPIRASKEVSRMATMTMPKKDGVSKKKRPNRSW